MEGLNDCIDTQCNKYGIDKSILTEWKYKVKSKISKKIKILYSNISGKYYKKMFQQKEPLHTLNNIHNKFAVTPIDKANSNIDNSMLCPYKRTCFRSEYN